MIRTVGVEEELLVVDAESGRPLSVAERVLRKATSSEELEKAGLSEDETSPGGTVEAELKRQQVETDTPPRTDLADLDKDVCSWRGLAVTAAGGVFGSSCFASSAGAGGVSGPSLPGFCWLAS